MSRRAALLVGIACLCAWALGAWPASAATPEALRECILENLPRYDDPDRALVAQYADIETTCRAALDGSESVDVQIVPGGGEDDGGGAAGQGPSEPPAGATPSAPGAGGDAPPARSAPGGGTGSAPAGAAPGGEPPGAAGALADAIRTADDGATGSSSNPLGGAPWWLLALVGAIVAIVAGGAIVELRRAHR